MVWFKPSIMYFVKCFSASIEMITELLYFILLIWCSTLLTFIDWTTLAFPGQIPLGMAHNPFTHWCVWYASILSGISVPIFIRVLICEIFLKQSILRFAGCHEAVVHTTAVAASWSQPGASCYFLKFTSSSHGSGTEAPTGQFYSVLGIVPALPAFLITLSKHLHPILFPSLLKIPTVLSIFCTDWLQTPKQREKEINLEQIGTMKENRDFWKNKRNYCIPKTQSRPGLCKEIARE